MVDPIENGKWKGGIEEKICDLKEDIKELKDKISNVYEIVNKIDKEVVVLKVKSGVWGFLAGLIPALVAFIYWVVNK